jgi:dTDP-4-dehydrorhamnose reductase
VAGVLHVVNEGQASRLDMARFCLEIAGLDPGLARPVASAELGLPAARPAYSVLDAGNAARLRGRALPPWRDALRRYLTLKEQA